ncbi:MAG: SDR family oxidoreductase [Thermoleophilaceae bacterium]|nr:SDR family oxidoreductase [Thermoleophilaceae bacterium]
MRPVAEQTILVTGSTDGLGRGVAEELATRGAKVIVHGRDPEKTRAVAEEIGAERALVADFASLDEVRRLAGRVGRLDTLVNNAGIIAGERRTSTDGHELTLAVNYLSHFVLTALLLDRLEEPGRIVNVASIGQAPFDFDDPGFEHGYDGYGAYARSKLAQITWSFELADRLRDSGITVNALHPATLMDTKMVREGLGRPHTSVEEGVRATLRLITDPELDGVTGRFFNGLREARANGQAYDPEARRRLWELSERLAA